VIRATLVAALALAAAACGGSTPSSPGPSDPNQANISQNGPCRYSVPADAVRQTIDGNERDLVIPVTTTAGCEWTVASQAEFISVSGAGSGTANGNATFHVASNRGAQRVGQLVVAGINLTITQQPLPCAFGLGSDSTMTFPSNGGTGSIVLSVTQGANCSWTATSSAAFVRITGASSGTGAAAIAFTVDANTTGASRTATITVASFTITLTQSAAPASAGCLFTIVPPSIHVGFGASSTTLVVTDEGGPTCFWNVTSDSGFVTIGPITHTSDTRSEVVVTIAANSGAARSGTITISNPRLTSAVPVSQDSGIGATACNFTVSPTSASVPASAGTTTLVVLDDGGPNCSWNVNSNAAFITVGAIVHTSDTRSEVNLNVGANGGPARTGAVVISNPRLSVTVTLTQSGS
jgi:hypothetical protein